MRQHHRGEGCCIERISEVLKVKDGPGWGQPHDELDIAGLKVQIQEANPLLHLAAQDRRKVRRDAGLPAAAFWRVDRGHGCSAMRCTLIRSGCVQCRLLCHPVRRCH